MRLLFNYITQKHTLYMCPQDKDISSSWGQQTDRLVLISECLLASRACGGNRSKKLRRLTIYRCRYRYRDCSRVCDYCSTVLISECLLRVRAVAIDRVLRQQLQWRRRGWSAGPVRSPQVTTKRHNKLNDHRTVFDRDIIESSSVILFSLATAH